MAGQMTYSNAYALLDEDEDGAPPAPVAKKEKEPKKAPAPKAAEKVEPPKPERTERNERNERPSSRGGRGGDGERGGRGGRGRGGRDGPRTGGGTNTHGREKKEYDRSESRTGRDRGAKKEGSGRGNWGTDDAEAKNGVRRRKEEVEAAAAEVPVVEEVVEEAAPVVEEAPVRPPKEEEEPDNSVTYEDYLKSKVAVEGDDKVARQVDNDESNWKAGAVMTKTEDPEDTYVIPGGAKGPKKKGPGTKAKKTMVSLDDFTKTNPQVSASRGGGGARGGGDRGRGGRGGARGGGPRGGAAAPRSNVNLGDAASFPTLGGK